MSLADKINMLMARPGPENAQKDDVPWWMRYAARGLGTVGSSTGWISTSAPMYLIAIFMGLFNCISILMANVDCMIAGVWQMLAGFLVIICEAPCCCFCIDYVQTLSDKIETRPYWNKAAMYMGLALPAFFMCFLSVSTWLGSGLIFGTGILYGMMALGRKASRDDMRSSAVNIEAGVGSSTTAPKANLVTNEQPFSFTRPPQ